MNSGDKIKGYLVAEIEFSREALKSSGVVYDGYVFNTEEDRKTAICTHIDFCEKFMRMVVNGRE